MIKTNIIIRTFRRKPNAYLAILPTGDFEEITPELFAWLSGEKKEIEIHFSQFGIYALKSGQEGEYASCIEEALQMTAPQLTPAAVKEIVRFMRPGKDLHLVEI